MALTPIYRVSSYVNWKTGGTVLASGGGGIATESSNRGIDGSGIVNQVAFWLDENTIMGDEGFTYEVDSAGAGILSVGYIRGLGDSAGDNTVLYIQSDSLFLGDGLIGCLPAAGEADTSVVMYDPVTGKLSFGTGGGSLWEDIGGILYPIESSNVGIEVDGLRIQNYIIDAQDGNLKHLTITAGDAIGDSASTDDGGDLILKAGDAIYDDNDSVQGSIYLVPGNPSQINQTGYVYIGHPSISNYNAVIITPEGTNANIGINFWSKGTGQLNFASDGSINLLAQNANAYVDIDTPLFICTAPTYILGFLEDATIKHTLTYNRKGYSLILEGAQAASVPIGSDYDGGDLHLNGGQPAGNGDLGRIFIGTGSAGTNPLAEAGGSDTYFLTYNPTTGQVTCMAI